MGQGLSSALVFIFVNPLAVSSLRSTEIEFRNLPLIGREISAVANGEFLSLERRRRFLPARMGQSEFFRRLGSGARWRPSFGRWR